MPTADDSGYTRTMASITSPRRTRTRTESERMALALWKTIYKMYNDNVENRDPKDLDAALMQFDLRPGLGPKIGLRRKDRLNRAVNMGITIPSEAVWLIENVPDVGEFVYSERAPHYLANLQNMT